MEMITAQAYAEAALQELTEHRARNLPDPKAYKTCMDCSGFPDDYMVQATTWAQASKTYRGHLCLACLETRIGRPLTIEDFAPVIINAPVFRGFLMGRKAQ